MGAAVQAVAGQQMVADAQHGVQRGRDRRHAGRGRQCGFRAFQRCQLVVEIGLRRRRVQPDVADVVVVGTRLHREHGALVDRKDYRAFGSRTALTGVHGESVDVRVAVAGHLDLLLDPRSGLGVRLGSSEVRVQRDIGELQQLRGGLPVRLSRHRRYRDQGDCLKCVTAG